jgi:Cu(I)/Ag(I) efflux system membrane fusion protein
LTTGRRRLVYVEQQPGEFHLTEPKLGPRAGDFDPVLDGLKSGVHVVTRGNFLLDSQFQITGKPSLLYPEGISGSVGHAGHETQSEHKHKH